MYYEDALSCFVFLIVYVMSKESVVSGGCPIPAPPVKKFVYGPESWEFFTKIGEQVFGCAYFNLSQPKDSGFLHNNEYNLKSYILGKLLTWAESSFEERRAEAVKSIFKDLIHQAFNRDRENYESMVSEFLADPDPEGEEKKK